MILGAKPGTGTAAATLAMLLLACTPVRGAEVWQGGVTPYLWMSGFGGDVTPVAGGPGVSFEESFGDILGTLDAALFVAGAARRGRLVLLADVNYVSTGDTVRVPPIAPPIDRARGEFTLFSATLAAGARLLDGPEGSLDLLGGARIVSINAEVEARAGPTTLARARDEDRFATPIIALRGRLPLSDDITLEALGDVGGAAGADLTWQVVGRLGYTVSERIALSAGYRHLAIDRDRNGRVFDVDLSGPLIGATLRF